MCSILSAQKLTKYGSIYTAAILYLDVTFLNFPPNHNASLLFSERCVCRFWALTVPSWDAGLLRRRWDAAARCEALVAYWDHLQHIFHTFQNPQDLEHLAPATTILMDAPPPLGKTHSYFFLSFGQRICVINHICPKFKYLDSQSFS